MNTVIQGLHKSYTKTAPKWQGNKAETRINTGDNGSLDRVKKKRNRNA